jgi:hypothetical protein
VTTARTGILAGYLEETDLAKELGRNVATVRRWRKMRIGPPYTQNGREFLYSVEGTRAWLARGGTNGAAPAKQRRSHPRQDRRGQPAE